MVNSAVDDSFIGDNLRLRMGSGALHKLAASPGARRHRSARTSRAEADEAQLASARTNKFETVERTISRCFFQSM
jgi:hypothetical protein